MYGDSEPGRWVDITPGQKQRAENEIESTNHCQLLPSDPEKRVIAEFVCRKAIAMVIDGGVYHPAQQVTSKYLITLLSFAGGAFAFVFALVMVFPRYLAWLRK